MKTRFLRHFAIEVARELCIPFGPCTERLILAGSLRRRKKEVGDIELLYIPKFDNIPDPEDLFGATKTIQQNRVDNLLAYLIAEEVIAKRANKNGACTWGEENKFGLHVRTSLPVDLFSATVANWWNLLVCRTGPADSNTQICAAAERRGWKWDPYSPGFLDRHTGALVHRTTSERDVFNVVGLTYAEPWER